MCSFFSFPSFLSLIVSILFNFIISFHWLFCNWIFSILIESRIELRNGTILEITQNRVQELYLNFGEIWNLFYIFKLSWLFGIEMTYSYITYLIIWYIHIKILYFVEYLLRFLTTLYSHSNRVRNENGFQNTVSKHQNCYCNRITPYINH